MANQGDWKDKVSDVINTCQTEIRRTTTIGKKMYSASKTNSCMNDALISLGSLILKDIRDNKVQWNNPEVDKIIDTISQCEYELQKIEEEMKEVKK